MDLDGYGRTFRQALKQYYKSHGGVSPVASELRISNSKMRNMVSGEIPKPGVAYDVAELIGLDPEITMGWCIMARRKPPNYQSLRFKKGRSYPPFLVRTEIYDVRTSLSLADVSCFDVVYKNKSDISTLLERGGHSRVIVMDPHSLGLGEYCRCYLGDENLKSSLFWEILATIERLKGLRSSSKHSVRSGEIEVKVHDMVPPPSIVIADRNIAYIRTPTGYRSGDLDSLEISRDFSDPRSDRIIQSFEELWGSGKSVDLDQFADINTTLPSIRTA